MKMWGNKETANTIMIAELVKLCLCVDLGRASSYVVERRVRLCNE